MDSGESQSAVHPSKPFTCPPSDSLLEKLKKDFARDISPDGWGDAIDVSSSSSESVELLDSPQVAGPSRSNQHASFGADLSNTPPHCRIQPYASMSRPRKPIQPLGFSVEDLDVDDEQPSSATISKAFRK
jgi:hypothetical protein